jgi:hypothetical protein
MLYGKDANNVQLINFSGVGALEPHQVEDFALSVVTTINKIIEPSVILGLLHDGTNDVLFRMRLLAYTTPLKSTGELLTYRPVAFNTPEISTA